MYLCSGQAAQLRAEAAENPAIYLDRQQPVEKRVEDLLPRMTLEEKVSLLSGETHMETRAIKRLGVPSLKMTDGPHGVGREKSTCFPTAVSMGASWNTELVQRVGVALAEEARAKGRNVLLGPCVNIHRTPLGGRNFESFGEDPYEVARMTVAYVKGVQSQKIATSTKHYACNNQEWDRGTIDVKIDERALREIYLPAFQAAVQEADTWTIMGAYNRVNGPYCCANEPLLTDILKKEWGFKGLVVSDWGATHSTVESANAGLDLEMPGPGNFFGAPLLAAVRKGEVKESVIDDKARRILRVMFLAGLFDQADPNLKGALDTEKHRALAREVAKEAIVLLKNEGGLLPLDRSKIKSIAVIGPNADAARLGGGGSSTVSPFYSVGPLEGLKKKCGESVKIRYAKGCLLPNDLLEIDPKFLIPAGGSDGEHGLKGEYFNNKDFSGNPALTRIDKAVNFDWGGGSPAPDLKADNFSVRWTGKLVPPKSGTYRLGESSDDGIRLYLDNKLLIDHWADHGTETWTKEVSLTGGRAYDIRIEYHESGGGAVARFGWVHLSDGPRGMLTEAVEAAAGCDVAVVFAGLSWEIEGEGVDRRNMDLPGSQAELIEAVAKANKNTIVVLINGTPVVMEPWLDKVAAVVEAWYPGQEGGNAIAEVLFGDVNPSGKLPVTFPKKLQDSPSYGNYPGKGGVVRYAEGIFVGYRHFDAKQVEPLFPFGHGLSYTKFKYSDLKISPRNDAKGIKIDVSLNLENAGDREGAEVVQLYVRDPQVGTGVERPFKELKAFKKIRLKPGEKQTVEFELDKSALAYYDVGRKQWVAEPGQFEILVGSSSRDIRVQGLYDLPASALAKQ